MKTTKAKRAEYLVELIPLLENRTQYWKRSMALDIEDDISSLESRISELEKRAAWANSMLERVKELFPKWYHTTKANEAWLADLAKGPSEGNGGGGK